MSRVEALVEPDLRSQLREFRTDIAMAIDDAFPLVHGLVDRNIISDQLLQVSCNFTCILRVRENDDVAR